MSSKPNFLIIVADDLGFTDVGQFGGEIDTPNLDALTGDGLRFTGFHTASACSPTRSMLFSGTDNHLAGLGQMAEFARDFPEKFGGKPGYEGYLNFKVAALSEILSPEYYTILSGKWHLGLDEPYWPDKRGFEQSFSLLPGAGNHYKFNLQEKQFLPSIYQENGRLLDAEKELPDDFYSTDYFTTKFLDYLEDEKRKDRPFLGLLTYTAPHWPLQAPPKTIEKYKGVYDKGPLELRKKRLQRAQELGIVPPDVVPHLVETISEAGWDELDEKTKAYSSRVMETYAAMVDELDQHIGRVINHLKKTGEFENTVIMFLSDNGAEGMMMEALPFGGKLFKDRISAKYDNSYENIGRGDSFVYYGDMWAQAATAPRYMYKMWASEGGINCPLIFHYPKLHGEGGKITEQFTTVMDILPTVLDLSNVPHPGTTFQGRQVYKPKGKSWVPYLAKSSDRIHDEDTVTGWELFGQRAIRRGPFKALYIPKPFGSGAWQLFDASKDLGEINDLSGQLPEILEELLGHWSTYCAETGLVELEELPSKDNVKFRVIQDN
ncbi:ZYRO0G03476p [Zygosaccharomyces rouxii]|uniref:ZYRO0G03476p n=1 Tax=Zygosaccharomyces rouxii (strain ATCC 2623 / CBS 732 / NBRC 1130 / NCYC 568 / NRRL Y-229) TaxID=559307 RepID=C5DZD5_ZYGRC|nr:uncharacterized protein ZYRO0G03476g [Zygosaccharomyces rouxii]KAH9202218.1 alkaline-phosphatase-like protein [Zygosaccharomyces rouxii]CAR29219.1 ZYRO0G03476p [Zygosaccharomyces rouxii]